MPGAPSATLSPLPPGVSPPTRSDRCPPVAPRPAVPAADTEAAVAPPPHPPPPVPKARGARWNVQSSVHSLELMSTLLHSVCSKIGTISSDSYHQPGKGSKKAKCYTKNLCMSASRPVTLDPAG